MNEKTGVLFVCLGNICRSPTAHAIFQAMVERHGLQQRVMVDSCGTGSWHIGQPPDPRMQRTAARWGYDLSPLRARRLAAEDFGRFQHILTMDTRNMAEVMKKAPNDFAGEIRLLLDYSGEKNVLEVPDPYYGGDDGFERVVTLIESACQGLVDHLKQQHG